VARSAYQDFVANYMKGRASSDFRANAGLMVEAAAAWRRRNPAASSLAVRDRGRARVRDNPAVGGLRPTMLAGIAAVGAYFFLPQVKASVDSAVAQLTGALGGHTSTDQSAPGKKLF
jgi:hypothetical protein